MGKEKTTFFNAIRASQQRICLLADDVVLDGHFLSFSERLAKLANRGEWLEALCLGLELGADVSDQLQELIMRYAATSIPWKFKIINVVEF
jgi:hypothetical protein